MTVVALTVFWTCVGLYLYTYAIFPLVMEVIHAFSNKKGTSSSPEMPALSVEVLMAAYNEESVMERTLLAIRQQDFPGSLNITIGSDASTDRTDDIVTQTATQDSRIRLVRFPGRTGKPEIINTLAKQSNADILLLMDADNVLGEHSLGKMVQGFRNESVNVVSPRVISNENDLLEGVQATETLYLGMEVRLKYLEGIHLGAVIGAFGGCYAVRRAAYHSVPKGHMVDDFYISMKAVEKGGRSILEPHAPVYERTSTSPKEEFRRRRRISAGNFQNLISMRFLLNPFSRVGWGFISHKVLRWTLPLLAPWAIAALCMLSFESSFYAILLFASCGTYLLSLIASRLKYVSYSPVYYPAHFAHMNIATILGFKDFLGGIGSNIWEPTSRDTF